MKNATKYEKQIKKLLRGMKKVPADEPLKDEEALAVLVESVLQADTTKDVARAALEAIQQEFVDFNELRASQSKDITDCIGKGYPDGRTKAEMITTALGNIYERTSAVSIDYMSPMTKRDLRRHLSELGLSPYVASCVVLQVFGGHAVPVDDTLVEVLKMDDFVHPQSDLHDVQGFLERVIIQKNALSAHEVFREYVANRAKALARKRKAEAKAKAQAEAKAKAKAEAKAEAKAAKAKKAAKKKAKKKPIGKKTTRKITKKTKKKSAKKTKKKGSRKASR